ncbi:MAG: hypothetical protein NDI63_12595 [Pseudobdellovibrio sp.]|nr:hypothetical protein [Pseudobdellovibrio sp.]
MKTLSLALKTITVGLTLVSSVSFAAEASREKFVDKAELMAILREGGIPEGTQKGLTLDGKNCELTISTVKGQEKVSMISEGDEYAQELIFADDLSDIKFRIRETANGISINQDFDDSYQDVKIEKVSRSEAQATFREYIAGDERTLTCSFK